MAKKEYMGITRVTELLGYLKTWMDDALSKKANKTDIPTSLPANGGNSDTVNNHTVKTDVPKNAMFGATYVNSYSPSFDEVIAIPVAVGKQSFYKFLSSGRIMCGSIYTVTMGDFGFYDGSKFHVIPNNNTNTVDGHTVASNVPMNAKFTDTTYEVATSTDDGLMSSTDKDKLDGISEGATANEGTVTSVSVKMNGSTKGTVTESGTIDLGTVITDVSGKQDKLTAGANITISGSTISATDTTYSVATTTANGLMSASDKVTLNGLPDEITTVDGKTKATDDVTIASKNLLELNLVDFGTKEVNGITFTNNGDGTITANGTATAQASVFISKKVFDDGITYKLLGCPSGGDATKYFIYLTVNASGYPDTGSGITFSNSGVTNFVSIIIRSGVTCNNLAFKPMVTEDITATYSDFEPYVTTTNTTTIPSANGRLHLTEMVGRSRQARLVGKNLLNSTLQTTTQSGVTCTRNADGSFTINGTATAKTNFNLSPSSSLVVGNTYKLVGCPSGGSTSTYRLDGGANLPNEIGSGATFTATSPTITLLISVYANTTCNNVVFKPMITTDITATYDSYEPYCGGIPSPNPSYPQTVEQVVNPKIHCYGAFYKIDGSGYTQETETTIPLTLNSVGDVRDYVDFDRNVVVRKVGKVDLGTLEWYYGTRFSASVSGINNISSLSTVANMLCTSYIVSSVSGLTDKRIAKNDGSDETVIVVDSDYTDASAFKTAMSGTYLFYELATPTEEPLTDLQMSYINSVRTVENATVSVESESVAPLLSARYFVDTEIGKAIADNSAGDGRVKFVKNGNEIGSYGAKDGQILTIDIPSMPSQYVSSVEASFEEGTSIATVTNADGTTSTIYAPAGGSSSVSVLWENPNPTASTGFDTQTITLSSDDYDYLTVVVAKLVRTDTLGFYSSYIVMKNVSSPDLYYINMSTSGLTKYSRDLTRVSDTSYKFGSGKYTTYTFGGSSGSEYTDDKNCIPLKIYGVKTS